MSMDRTKNQKPRTKNGHVFSRTSRAQRGFTLLLAALVSSIVLAVGAAIFSIAQKQVALSVLGRDSQFAFYAADTAAECALYWDFRCNYFASSTADIKTTCVIPDPPGPLCDRQQMKPFLTDRNNPPSYPYTITSGKMNLFTDIDIVGSGDLCAQVSVTKCQGPIDSSGVCTTGPSTDPVRTLIHADGYSASCDSLETSTRVLQRTAEWRY